MIFRKKQHLIDLYSILLSLSRNKFFYQNINLPDTFQTRIYLMFMHFSVMLIIYKKKGKKFDQKSYDYFFHNIENNLREMGLGDVSVNKKMKDLNKILYDILLKLENQLTQTSFKINRKLINKYFNHFNDPKSEKFTIFENYLTNFYNFCFELPLEIMVKRSINFIK
jgi:cytochrome b pre-mRNA-processing protein 3